VQLNTIMTIFWQAEFHFSVWGLWRAWTYIGGLGPSPPMYVHARHSPLGRKQKYCWINR